MISPPSTTFVIGFIACLAFVALRDRILFDPYVLVILLLIMLFIYNRQ